MTHEERVTHIHANRWIQYPRAEQVLAKLEESLALPQMHRMPNVLLVGDTNNGKTALIRRFSQKHLPEFDPQQSASSIPLIIIQAPPAPEERRFYQAILSQVFEPFRPSHSAGHLQHQVLRLLSTVQTKMLIIDEIHHILAGPLLKQRHFLNVIKYLGNELRIPIVAIGTHDAFHAIATDEQLANRFEPMILQRWTMNADYLRLLASFEQLFALQQSSSLPEPALARKILHISGGTIGEISSLLRQAAIEAIDRGTEQITGELLDSCGYMSPLQRRQAASAV